MDIKAVNFNPYTFTRSFPSLLVICIIIIFLSLEVIYLVCNISYTFKNNSRLTVKWLSLNKQLADLRSSVHKIDITFSPLREFHASVINTYTVQKKQNKLSPSAIRQMSGNDNFTLLNYCVTNPNILCCIIRLTSFFRLKKIPFLCHHLSSLVDHRAL